MKRILWVLVIAGTSLLAMYLASPAKADVNSYISAIENDPLENYTGDKADYIQLGYRICADTASSFSRYQIVNGVYNNPHFDFDWVASNEIVTLAQQELCS